jgi:hypothetical protein
VVEVDDKLLSTDNFLKNNKSLSTGFNEAEIGLPVCIVVGMFVVAAVAAAASGIGARIHGDADRLIR